MLALTHIPSPRLDEGLSTLAGRAPVDIPRAVAQHEAYCQALRDCGARVVTLDVNREMPDSVFIEDAAIVLDELAIMTSMGAESRRAEVPGIEAELKSYRRIARIELPATIEGGDVLRVGPLFLAGLSRRTNPAGVAALAALVKPFGYSVRGVPVHGCLHFKTACTALPDGRLLVNPAWLDMSALGGWDIVPVPESEPHGANVALVNGHVLAAAAHARTNELIRSLGFDAVTVDLSEFAKVDGAVTCSCLLLQEKG